MLCLHHCANPCSRHSKDNNLFLFQFKIQMARNSIALQLTALIRCLSTCNWHHVCIHVCVISAGERPCVVYVMCLCLFQVVFIRLINIVPVDIISLWFFRPQIHAPKLSFTNTLSKSNLFSSWNTHIHYLFMFVKFDRSSKIRADSDKCVILHPGIQYAAPVGWYALVWMASLSYVNLRSSASFH